MGRRQTGIRLHDVAGNTLEEKVANAHAQGFKCVQLVLAKCIKDHSTADAALTPGFAMYLKKLFASYDMDIAVLGCYLNLATPDRDDLARNMARYRAHIRFASLLGCGVVGTETGAPNRLYLPDPACRSEEALNVFIENLKPVVGCAQSYGVNLAIEPVTRHIVYNAERAKQVLDAIDSPNLRIILDPVNLIDGSNHREQKSIVKNAIDILGPYIDIIHVKDYNVVAGVKLDCAVGGGVMDYSELVGFIEREKPYIQCTLENTKPSNAVKAKEYFEAVGC